LSKICPVIVQFTSYLFNDCKYNVQEWLGMRGRAIASVDIDCGVEILERLLYRYVGGVDNPLAERLLGRTDLEVAIRLDPKNFYTWNFTTRMADSLDHENTKVCPD
jgi:hypothetical protein